MINNIVLQEGTTTIEVHALTNYDELTVALKGNLEQFKGYKVTEATEEADKKTLEYLKSNRKPLKDFRAALNKELTAKTKEELGKADAIIKLLDEVISPIESGLDDFAEARRLEKRQRKLDKFMPLIEECNKLLNEIDIPHFKIPLQEFKEEWFNKKDDDISMAIDDETQRIKTIVENASGKLELSKIFSEQVKEMYCLKADIDVTQLKERLYQMNNAEIKVAIEELAENQQKIEMKVETVIEEKKEFIQEQKQSEKKVATDDPLRTVRISLRTKEKGNLIAEIERVLRKEFNIEEIKIIEA